MVGTRLNYLPCFIGRLSVILAVSAYLPFYAIAFETDEFFRPSETKNSSSTGELSRLINDHLDHFVSRYNETFGAQKFTCDRKFLNEKIRYYFNNNSTRIAYHLRDIAKNDPEKKGKYRFDFWGPPSYEKSIFNGTSLGWIWCCERVLNVDGTPMGVDKIDHFFGNGSMLWEKEETLAASGTPRENFTKQLLEVNAVQEHGMWGLRNFSVKSYGDLSANWAGLQFYRQLMDGANPYLKCTNNQLVRTERRFRLGEYFNKSWSETYNCSSYANKEFATRVTANLKARGMACPLERSGCDEIVATYKSSPLELNYLVSPSCRSHVNSVTAVEKPVEVNWMDAFVIPGFFQSIRQNLWTETYENEYPDSEVFK